MKKSIKEWLIVMVLLLDEAAAVALALLVLWYFKIEVPLPVAIVVALVLGIIVFIITKAVIPTFRKKQVTGSEGMIGMEGEVIKPLAPVGIIRVEGEYWKAKSVGEDIAAGEDVEILRINRLILEVKRKG